MLFQTHRISLMLFIFVHYAICDQKSSFCEWKIYAPEDQWFTCQCNNHHEEMVVLDTRIRKASIIRNVPIVINHWKIKNCATLHLRGSALSTLIKLQTLEVVNVKMLHIDQNFFNCYSSSLQSLVLSQLSIAPLDGSLKLELQNISSISINNVNLNGFLQLLIRNNHSLEMVSITNSVMTDLSQISLSSRKVDKFILKNNSIHTIKTGAILHRSTTSSILNNVIEKIDFLGIDIISKDLFFASNKIKYMTFDAVDVKNTSFIQVENNIFEKLDRLSFTWLRPAFYEGKLTFVGNKFYAQNRGILLFHFGVYNQYLNLSNNIFIIDQCDCKSFKVAINRMTEADNKSIPIFLQERQYTADLLLHSSFCQDKHNRYLVGKSLCKNSSNSTLIVISFTLAGLFLVIIILLVAYIKRKKQYEYRRKVITYELSYMSVENSSDS
ncbi:uncharacterized protein LOC143028633 isoform X1 [Oratosquilla oratoria]|uniref:uncharacterized protein LOC143028633 isoform X1 n=1 Tax=Oratosquilla oratoria TaxID=337810 RepID=UPI003F757873